MMGFQRGSIAARPKLVGYYVLHSDRGNYIYICMLMYRWHNKLHSRLSNHCSGDFARDHDVRKGSYPNIRTNFVTNICFRNAELGLEDPAIGQIRNLQAAVRTSDRMDVLPIKETPHT